MKATTNKVNEVSVEIAEALDKLLGNYVYEGGKTKNEVRKEASLTGCEYRYSGKLGKGFIHQIVHPD